MKRNEIEKILRNHPDALVLCDEAYIDFGGESSMELTAKYDNLLVVHTLSKSRCLAGARVGFAVANAELTASLNAIRNSFNSYTLDRFSMKIAAAAIEDAEYFENCREKVIGTRNLAVSRLREIGFEVLDSSANFVFARPLGISARSLYEKLKENGVLVRYWDKERIRDWLRITVGTDAEMKILIDKTKEILTNS
jgi:histidinol-phosphate aminotransferase